ncbi:MAG: DUF4276 family protein [candidate division WOR-3 bacterium]
MKIALIVEGRTRPSSEERVITILARKIVPREVGITSRIINRGDLLNNERKVYACVNDMLQDNPDISKVIICVDSECTPEEDIKNMVVKIEKNLTEKIGVPIYYVVVVHALEAWLLADADNIKEHLKTREKISISPSVVSECRPKEVLKGLYRKTGKDFIPMREYPQIAEKLNIAKMRDNVSFSYFHNKVKDP